MGLFAKKISKDMIADSLVGMFAASRDAILKGLLEFLEEGTEISNEQDHEIMIVSIFAIAQAIRTALGDNSPEGSYITGKFQDNIFKLYSFTEEERENFKKKLWARAGEYSEILKAENEDLAIQFGQIFCDHFFGKKEDGNRLAIMMFIGGAFISNGIEVKKTLDETLSKFVII